MTNQEITEEIEKVQEFAVKHLKETTGIDVVVEVIPYISPETRKQWITQAEKLLRELCHHDDFSVKEIKGASRKQEVALFRHKCIAVLSVYFDKLTLKTRGLIFGGRQHSDVLHSMQVNKDMCDTNRDYKSQYEDMLGLAKDFLGR